MLHKETISPHTLELLIRLQQKEYLKGFYLVGGTALALQIGHRTSIDIDLFSDFSFDAGQILENLSVDFDFKLFFSANNTLKGSIDSVQVDILAHRYPFVSSPLNIEHIAMLSTEDIIAMKLNAISISGQRIKDFIDIYYLLNSYSISDMIHFYKKKYVGYNEINVLKSLTWFEDIDHSDWPLLLRNPELKWPEITKKIILETRKYLRKN
ncbi:MAG: nucleotidyl transferase AbiEii/AbiGii toxin family protein [Eubacteriales bacterium]